MSTKRSIDDVESSIENISPKKQIHLQHTSFQTKIMNMFEDAGLTPPSQLLGKELSYDKA